MATAYNDLFGWSIITITWSIIFIVGVTIYLYVKSRKAREGSPTSLIRNFTFVWILIILLMLYIISIKESSAILFAAGNVAVESYLIYYIMSNRTKTEQRNETQETKA